MPLPSAARLTIRTMGAAQQTLTKPTAAPADVMAHLEGLCNARAVRERCHTVRRWVAAGNSPHFTLADDRLVEVADFVAELTRANYPDLAIPPHSRWRHFSAGRIDRWSGLAKRIDKEDAGGRARAAFDLAVVSVLLDAGAGDRWRYREPVTGQVFARSEGLAVASLDMFAAGGFSSDRTQPLRVDAPALKAIDDTQIARGLQAGVDNPIVGLDGRTALLRRLGQALEARPDLFGERARPGHLVDHLLHSARDAQVSAPELLSTLLMVLSPIWPSGLVVDGANVGDAGLHPAVRTGDATDRIVPFHKLSQWMTCSLLEPLAIAGLTMVDLDGLTALAEYRNGGLLIDLGVIEPRRPIVAPQEVSSELVVEWRALTVALIDELLGPVRERLDLGAGFTLLQLLQAGTWSAGREIARVRRPPNGPPPIPLIADGTVF
jgi:hypothetical protein